MSSTSDALLPNNALCAIDFH